MLNTIQASNQQAGRIMTKCSSAIHLNVRRRLSESAESTLRWIMDRALRLRAQHWSALKVIRLCRGAVVLHKQRICLFLKMYFAVKWRVADVSHTIKSIAHTHRARCETDSMVTTDANYYYFIFVSFSFSSSSFSIFTASEYCVAICSCSQTCLA